MIIKNNTEGYGYKYASLGDIAEQGVEIPKMKTGTEDGAEYVYYFDADLKDWIRGARVVVPENKGMNKAQLYASAITYARRVTVQLAKGIACADDEAIEDTDANGEPKTVQLASEKQLNYIRKLYDEDMIARITSFYKIDELADLNVLQAKEVIEKALKRNEEHHQ